MAKLKGLPKLGAIKADSPAPAKPPPPTQAEGRPQTALGRPTLFPQGPEVLGLGRRRERGLGGPGIKPADFPGTGPEWVWFYISKRKLSPNEDPRRGPYTGALDGSWQFQVPEDPNQPRAAGGSVSDFIYFGTIIVRIEGFYWHTNADAAQQARDLYLMLHAGNTGTRIESVEDGEFMHDPTGAAAGRLLADILAGRSRIGAIRGGTAMPPRYDPALQGGAV